MNHDAEAGFRLDPRLAADTVFVADWELCRVLLMDDARFPWLVLVPRRPGLVEIDDLDDDGFAGLMQEIRRAMQVLRGAVQCDKLNVGALGNIVAQLHVHVVVRRTGDAAWPGPAWGHGPAQRYLPGARDERVESLRRQGREHPRDRDRTRHEYGNG